MKNIKKIIYDGYSYYLNEISSSRAPSIRQLSLLICSSDIENISRSKDVDNPYNTYLNIITSKIIYPTVRNIYNEYGAYLMSNNDEYIATSDGKLLTI